MIGMLKISAQKERKGKKSDEMIRKPIKK